MRDDKLTEAVMLDDGTVLIKQQDGSYLPSKGKTGWKRLKAMKDVEIEKAAEEDPDNPPLDEDFWSKTKAVETRRKVYIHAGFDEDVLAYFKTAGRGYQTRMNAVLRSYVEAQTGEK